MKTENVISFFIYALVISLYLFFVSSLTSITFFRHYGELIAFITFSASLIGLLFISFNLKRSYSYIYYIMLFFTAILLMLYRVFISQISNIIKYYFVLAVLIGLLLSLIDLRSYYNQKYNLKKYKKKIFKLKKKVEITDNKLKEQIELSNKFKVEIQNKNAEIKNLIDNEKLIKSDLNKSNRELNKSKDEIVNLNSLIESLKTRNKNLTEKNKQITVLEKEKNKLEKELKKTETEISKQTELKAKYSKTLSNLRRKKKEEEELLVVSSDGKSVHRPKCISVRNVPKESRKLIKNWTVAKKEGYEGCKLCNPHVKPAVIIRQGKKYKFVGAKNSDKVHKVSCILVKNIAEKERSYFKTYKEALTKKYTSCRVCNPDQYQNS